MGWKRKTARTDELLSAYLDGELSPEERTRLEARLVADPDLRARLGAMRRTVDLVRDLPQVKAPRNFILTPDMVAPARRRPVPLRRRLAPILTFATAISALACALVLIGNLAMLGTGGFGAVPAAAPPREVAMEPVDEEAEMEPSPQPLSEGPWMGIESVVTETLEMTRTAGPEAAATLEEKGPPSLTLTASPAPTVTEEEKPAEAGATITLTPSPAAMGEGAPLPIPPPSPRPGWSLLLALGLALLTLGLLVATIQAWRTRA